MRAVSRQRVNMRNEMFRNVITGVEIESLIAARTDEVARKGARA
jgi:hypothetical protein